MTIPDKAVEAALDAWFPRRTDLCVGEDPDWRGWNDADLFRENMRAALAAAEQAMWERRVRPRKRGGTYRVIGNAQVQACEPLTDWEVAVVYVAEDGEFAGKMFVRRLSEFNDGRFEDLPIPPPPETKK